MKDSPIGGALSTLRGGGRACYCTVLLFIVGWGWGDEQCDVPSPLNDSTTHCQVQFQPPSLSLPPRALRSNSGFSYNNLEYYIRGGAGGGLSRGGMPSLESLDLLTTMTGIS